MAMSTGQAGAQGAGNTQLTLLWRRFIRWWGGELAACVPAGLRRGFSSQRLLVVAGSEGAEVFAGGAADGAPAASLTLGGEEAARVILPHGATAPPWGDGTLCRVLLESGAVLHKMVTLPVEAERNLRGVLLASMERYTPLPVGEIYFDFFISKRRPEARKLDVALYLTPKARIDRLAERLRGVGLHPEGIDVRAPEGGAGQGVGVNLLPAGVRRSDRRWLIVNRALAASALLLLGAVLVLPVVQSRAAVERLSEAVAAERDAVQQAERTRGQVDARLEALKQLQQRKTQRPTTVAILAELTRLIPDTGWAGQVEVHEERVRLSGEAESASDLIRLLTASALFSDPRFEAPLTQNPRTNRERFVISLALPATPKVN